MNWLIRSTIGVVRSARRAVVASTSSDEDTAARTLTAIGVLVVGLLLTISCGDTGGTGVGPVDTPGPTAVIDQAGGVVLVGGAPPVESVALRLPAGVLSTGESATLSLTSLDTAPEELPPLNGASPIAYLELEVTPDALRDRVIDALDIELTVTLDSPSLDTAAATLLAADPGAWADAYIVAATPAEPEDFSQLDVCTPKSPTAKSHDFVMKSGKFLARTDRFDAAVVIAPLRTLQLFRITPGRPVKTKGGVYHLATPLRRAPPYSHPHLGDVQLAYYPVSVTAATPVAFDDAQRDDIWGCLKMLLNGIGNALKDADFPPLGIASDAPLQIAIFDFDPDPAIVAQANYKNRWMALRTNFIDAGRYAAPECFTPQNVVEVFILAHELFHWQQDAIFSDRQRGGDWRARLDAWRRWIPHPTVGPHSLPEPLHHSPNLWISEGTANLFAYELVRGYPFASLPDANGEGGHFKHGLTAFPLSGAPWLVRGGKLWLDGARIYSKGFRTPGEWAYRNVPYFKFLTDREPEETDELKELAALYTALGATLRAAPADGAALDLTPAALAWGASNGRDWFDFFREFRVLHGCGPNTCPAVAVDDRHTFARTESPRPDLYGNTKDPAGFWAEVAPANDPLTHDTAPFTTASGGWVPEDAGATLVNVDRCRFDTVVPAYVELPLSAREIAERPDNATTQALPENLAFGLTGVRVDARDDLDYASHPRWRWELTAGAGCSPDLRFEAWRRTAEPETLTRPKGVSALPRGVAFDSVAPTDDSDHQVTTWLIGNPKATPTAGTGAACEVTLTITPAIGCPAPAADAWTPRNIGTSVDLKAVDINGETVWVGGADRALFKSSDGGSSWAPVTMPASVTAGNVVDIAFDDADSGWVVVDSPGRLLHTDNGGASWESVDRSLSRAICPCADRPCSVPVGEDPPEPSFECEDPFVDLGLRRVTFATGHGVASTCCDGYALVQRDGDWWRERIDGAIDAPGALAGRPGSSLIFAGRRGTGDDWAVFRGDAAGSEWEEIGAAPLADVAWRNDAELVGVSGQIFGGTITRSVDGGATWAEIHAPKIDDGLVTQMSAISVHPSGAVVAVGAVHHGGVAPETGFVSEADAGLSGWRDSADVAPRALRDVDAGCERGCAVGDEGAVICR